ncbi:MAG: sensor domain-containing phosphodiesterase [Arenimonas sp.]
MTTENSVHPEGDAFLSGETWLRLRDALLDISRHPFVNDETSLERILASSSTALSCRRVGLWLFEADNTELRCAALFQDGKMQLNLPMVLYRDKSPRYFEALNNLLTLAAHDAANDSRTSEFSDNYLAQNNIAAMLDVPVTVFGQMIGVLCHEHIGSTRHWTDEERVFCCAISALASQSLEHRRLHQMENERNRALFFDHLTGVANRGLMLDRLSQLIHAGESAALLLIDIDRFSNVLQAIGDEDADAALVEIVDRLASLTSMDRIGRMGNDEFAVVVISNTPMIEAMKITSKIQSAIARPIFLGHREIVLTASVGIVADIRLYNDASDCLRDATIALSAAIQTGRGGQELFTSGMNELAKQRMTIEQDIRRGMQQNEFLFFYQPILDADTQLLLGAEALLRWQHPEKGLLAPAAFIEVAEESGALLAIQPRLIREAFKSLAAWRRLPGYEGFRLSFNFSPEQLTYPGFAYDLQLMLDEAGLGFEALQGEITENTLLHDKENLLPILLKFSQSGLALALDDFGTGYASVTHLAQLPLQMVKLDRSYVSSACDDARMANIVQHLIALAQSLNLRVIAEGVETQAQYDLLRKSGCDEVQGYFFSRPLALADFEARYLSGASLSKV